MKDLLTRQGSRNVLGETNLFGCRSQIVKQERCIASKDKTKSLLEFTLQQDDFHRVTTCFYKIIANFTFASTRFRFMPFSFIRPKRAVGFYLFALSFRCHRITSKTYRYNASTVRYSLKMYRFFTTSYHCFILNCCYFTIKKFVCQTFLIFFF